MGCACQPWRIGHDASMRPESLDFFKRLLEATGPSSGESPVTQVWLDYVRPYADEVKTDAYGNAVAIINPEAQPRVFVAGHSDEIGMQITYINDQGYAYVQPVGGSDRTMIRGQRVTVHGRDGNVPGVIGSLAIHMQDRMREPKPPQWHEVFVDIGAADRAEAEQHLRVGDLVTIAATWQPLLGTAFASRACDNRIGLFAAAEALRLVHDRRDDLVCGFAAGSTVQEEVGLNGARMVAELARPDVSLVVDVDHATDIPLVKKEQFGDIKLGKGPIVRRGTVNHPRVVARLEQVAETSEIPFQRGIDPMRSGTDADMLFVQHGGIPTAALGLPNRYMHSPNEVIDLRDLETMARLCAEFAVAAQLGETFWADFKWSG